MNNIFAFILIYVIGIGVLFSTACTQVDISSGAPQQKVCVGNDSLNCSDTSTDTSNDGDDNNTTGDTTN